MTIPDSKPSKSITLKVPPQTLLRDLVAFGTALAALLKAFGVIG